MSKRELTPDEEWDEAQPFIRSAYIKFVAGLQQAAAGYGSGNHNKECAAMAVGATFDFVKAVHVGPHLLAPLGEALEIIGASLPDKPKDVITSMTTVRKILGSVAVEYQMLNNVSLDQALKNVVGGDARERKRLKDFRYNMKEKDSPKGAREEFFSMMRLLNESIEGLFAFLAPDLVKAAVEGRLPRGIGVERLRDASPSGPDSLKPSDSVQDNCGPGSDICKLLSVGSKGRRRERNFSMRRPEAKTGLRN